MATVRYSKKYNVELSDIDFKKQLKLSSLFTYFQDISSFAASELNLGIDKLINVYGVSWTLVRVRVDITRMPIWNEEITIETWPIEPKTLEFERDFIIKDQSGNIIIKAVSSWVILDLKTRRLKKTSTINPNYPELIHDRAIECHLGKFKANGELNLVYQKVVGYSDIDFNGHINNSKYIDFIMDCFNFENHQNYQVKSLEVSFVNEALWGDTITLYQDVSHLDENQIYIEGINEKDQKQSFKAQFLFEKIL